jgi:hypothetical protein
VTNSVPRIRDCRLHTLKFADIALVWFSHSTLLFCTHISRVLSEHHSLHENRCHSIFDLTSNFGSSETTSKRSPKTVFS